MENMENLESIEQVVENVQEVIPVQENQPGINLGKLIIASAVVQVAFEVAKWASKKVRDAYKKHKAEKKLADCENVFDQAPLEIDEDDDK